MCKLRQITHKFNICRSLHIDKNQKIKFHSYNEKNQQLKGGRLSSRNKHLGAALPDINLYVAATKDYFAFLFWSLSKSVSLTYLLLYQILLLINVLCAALIHNVQVTLFSSTILSFTLILKAGHDLIPCMFITF